MGLDLKKGGMVYLLRRNIKIKRLSDKLDHTKLGPFKIKEKKGPVTFKLDLLKGIRIYSIFYILLLEPAPNKAKTGPIYINEETQQPYYEIDKVMGTRLIDGKRHYLIYWKGYQHSEDTWELENNFIF